MGNMFKAMVCIFVFLFSAPLLSEDNKIDHTLNEGMLKLSTQEMEMQFQVDPYFALLSLKDNLGHQWLKPGVEGLRFWEIKLEAPDGTAPKYTNRNSIYTGYELIREEQNLELMVNWKMEFTPNLKGWVQMTIKLTEGSELSSWHLSIQPPKDWKIHEVIFPVFSNMSQDGNPVFIAPKCWGMEYQLDDGFIYEETYPAWSAFQMMAFNHGKHGFYAGAHDQKAGHKIPVVQAYENTFTWHYEHIPQLKSYNEEPYELGFPIVIGVYKGDYLAAAEIYREFALETEWGKKSPLSGRDLPAWLKEIDVSFLVHGVSEPAMNGLHEALDYFDMPSLLHWYTWHNKPFDTYYPEYFPTVEGFKDEVRKAQAKDGHVMPYINGRLWDPATESWQQEEVWRYAVQRLDGRGITEIYGSGALNNVMCPAADFWQDRVKAVTMTLFEDYLTDGVYVDQLSAAYAIPCYDKTHPHPPGGGSYWHDGYRQMLEKIHRDIPVGRIISSEDGAECWIDQVDVHLMVNTPLNGRIIPLYPAIYSDRVVLLASQYFRDGDIEAVYPFRIKNMRSFLWGAIPGWISPSYLMNEEHREEARFLADMARVRRQAHSVLWEGRFLGMMDIQGNIPTVEFVEERRGSIYTMKEKGVQGALWKGPCGKYGVLLVNILDEGKSGSFLLPEDIEFEQIVCYDGDNNCKVLVPDEEKVTFNIPAASSLFIAFECNAP